MRGSRRYEAEWEGLRLVVDQCPVHFQAFVYDPAKCEVLYTCERSRLGSAKFAAIEFAAAARFGFGDAIEFEIIAGIAWTLAGAQARSV